MHNADQNSPFSISIRDLIRPFSALAFASLFSCLLLGLRIVLIGQFRQLYLVWNLVLAWMPLFFALSAVCLAHTRPQRRWWFLSAAAAWLLFFPNAPYILTDLVHLGPKAHGHYWGDLILILLFALIGLVLGFLSLFLMQRLVARRYGWPAGWLFAGIVAGLSGFGTYAGRFLRWNSWDVVLDPLALLADAGHWVAQLSSRPRGLITPVLFAIMLFITYLLLYSLTRLPAGLKAEMNTSRT